MKDKYIPWIFDIMWDEARLLTIDEVAKILSVSRSTVYRLVCERELPCVNIRTCIRISDVDVINYLHDRYSAL